MPVTDHLGVYTLANDAVIDWFVALAASLRAHEPGLPVTVIPFDDRLERVRAVCDRFGFPLYDGPELGELDAVGESLYPEPSHARHAFRKLAVFWGPFSHGLFLDSDVVVLGSDLSELLARFARSSRGIGYYNTCMDAVYPPGVLRDELVARGAVGFNTGTLLVKRGALSIEQVRETAVAAHTHRQALAHCFEQPFLNFACDVNGLAAIPFLELSPELAPLCWAAGIDRLVERDGRFYVPWDGQLRQLPLIHWAGESLPARSYGAVHRRYLDLAAELLSASHRPGQETCPKESGTK